MRIIFCFMMFAITIQGMALDNIKIREDLELLDIKGKTYLYSDKTDTMTVVQIAAMPDALWKKKPLTGYSEHSEWVMVQFENESEIAFDKVLYLNNPISHILDFYFVENGVLQEELVATGLARSAKSKLYNDPCFPVRLHLPAKGVVKVLIRIFDPLSSMNAPLFLMGFDTATRLKDKNLSFSFLWIGILVLSLMLALFMYVSIRQDIFLYYIMFGISTGMIGTANLGILFLFIDSDPYQIVTNYYQVGAVIMINFMPRFLNSIVPISEISRRAWHGMKAMGYLAICIAVLYSMPYFKFSFFFTNLFINTMVSLTALLFLYLLITLCIASVKKMDRALTLFVVYLIYLTLAFSNVILPLFGVADKGLDGFNLVLMGSVFETIAFMILMAQVTLSVYRERENLYKQVQSNQEIMMEAIVKGQEDERNRFAKDLHDGFGQMISSLMLNIKGLETTQSTNIEKRSGIFRQSTSILNDMYVELKNICFNLMPQTLLAAGVGEALKEFANRINESGEIIVEVSLFDMEERLTEIQEISIYRISQEWINNIIKYSNASKIELQITKDEDEITLLIEDNGTGFDKSALESGKGNGWKNIHSRANLIKGEVELDTTVGIKGNTFILNAPAKLDVGVKNDLVLTN
ncbi:7TM-DISM domain-containing protein [Reichenbachiella sp. MALMAid0571]|uniref:sensor histidine kinase n=1 Tax=Reichenbachiella sp. MALMAid0571 TaxID=3143939 RepID=UPI0032DEB858